MTAHHCLPDTIIPFQHLLKAAIVNLPSFTCSVTDNLTPSSSGYKSSASLTHPFCEPIVSSMLVVLSKHQVPSRHFFIYQNAATHFTDNNYGEAEMVQQNTVIRNTACTEKERIPFGLGSGGNCGPFFFRGELSLVAVGMS